MGRDLPCIGRGLSIGNKYTNSPRIDGVEPKTKTASTEELPCASGGGAKVVCICHSNPCICRDVVSLLHKIAWRKSHERFCQQTTNHGEDIRFG